MARYFAHWNPVHLFSTLQCTFLKVIGGREGKLDGATMYGRKLPSVVAMAICKKKILRWNFIRSKIFFPLSFLFLSSCHLIFYFHSHIILDLPNKIVFLLFDTGQDFKLSYCEWVYSVVALCSFRHACVSVLLPVF